MDDLDAIRVRCCRQELAETEFLMAERRQAMSLLVDGAMSQPLYGSIRGLDPPCCR